MCTYICIYICTLYMYGCIRLGMTCRLSEIDMHTDYLRWMSINPGLTSTQRNCENAKLSNTVMHLYASCFHSWEDTYDSP